jgi:single-stranded-DNA-specific exonuclease
MRARRIQQRPLLGDPKCLSSDLPGVLRRVYAARGVDSSEQIDYTLDKLMPPDRLHGLDQAVALLVEVIEANGQVVVIGDFDADGATSCALCLRALRGMGAVRVGYLVPNRFEYGYGLTPEIVAVAAIQRPDLLITVDNGISSLTGVAAARERGIRVLITDHHLPAAELPPADAIVNPCLSDEDFPGRHLAGVGVAFYVMLALRAALRNRGWFIRRGIDEPNLGQLLDLVALGTVADVVPLDRNNRLLVEQGLRRIRAGRCVPGLRALLEVGGRSPARAVAADLGFVVGPRLNAAGRLEDMSLGIECLLAEDEAGARAMATRLDSLNRDRREIESGMQTQALAVIESLLPDSREAPVGFCLFDPDWHQGVIGILAARIKDRFHRPVIAFARSGQGELKGSARSIAGLHIRDVLDAIAVRHPELLQRFGGHAMAAGLTLAEEHLPAFETAFRTELERVLCAEDLQDVLYTDGELAEEELSLATAQRLREAGPWGQGFPAPCFEGQFTIREQRVVGERHLKMILTPIDGVRRLEAIAFNSAPQTATGEPVRLVYRLDVNEYRGLENAQLVVEHIESGTVAADRGGQH